jgi:hypothetical protein
MRLPFSAQKKVMTFRKPLRTVAVRRGPHSVARRRKAEPASAARTLWLAVMAGLAVGAVLSVAANSSRSLARRNTPPAGAYYSGCNAARAAGVAPLYAGEPGYRPEMDGDGDGIACEPYRGR